MRAQYSNIIKHQKLWVNKKNLPCLIDQIKFGREEEQASQLGNEGSTSGFK